MSEKSPLAQKEVIHFEDLHPFIEIGHADPYVPSLSLAEVKKEELPDDGERRIFVFERASQFAVLSKNEQTFMWVSPLPEDILKRYSLVQKICLITRRNIRICSSIIRTISLPSSTVNL